MSEEKLRAEVTRICRKLERKGLVAAADGNVSCRAGENRLLITPSGVSKGEVEPGDLIAVDMNGVVLEGKSKPSSEILMHLFVYRNRRDVAAIAHAHPAMVTAFTLAGLPFGSAVLPEVWLTLGEVPTAPYGTPSTSEVPESIAPFVEKSRAIILERHGALTFGKDPYEAYMRMEKLEHAAHTLFYASLLKGNNPPAPLFAADLEKLERAFGK
jgi:L-fuculose-phosphate aldolase